jgi:IMP dehydrogenase
MDKAYTFSDVAIKQKFFRGKSRNDVDTSSDLGFFKLSIPIMTANMKSVTGSKMAIAAAESGAMGILHRFNTIDQAVQEFQDVMCLEETSITASGCVDVDVLKEAEYVTYTKSSATPVRKPINPYSVGVSVGVQEYDKARFDRLYAAGAKVFCIDISHGWQESMKQMIKWIRGLGLKDVCLMAGNVADREGVYDLANWGADIVKCGIGPGCFVLGTRIRTNKGYKKIEQIQIGDKVLTHRGRYREVIGLSNRREEKEICVVNGERCTSNHEFYVLHKKYSAIVTDDNINEYAEWLPSSQLTKDYLLLKVKDK